MDFYTRGFNAPRRAYLLHLDHFPCVFRPLYVVIRGLTLKRVLLDGFIGHHQVLSLQLGSLRRLDPAVHLLHDVLEGVVFDPGHITCAVAPGPLGPEELRAPVVIGLVEVLLTLLVPDLKSLMRKVFLRRRVDMLQVLFDHQISL